MQVIRKPVTQLAAQEKDSILRIFREAFDVGDNAEELIERYCGAVKELFLAYDPGLVAFQFYQATEIENITVHHFSIACKSSSYRRTGLQRIFGETLIRQLVGTINPFARCALFGVCNNPKSYANMISIGGEVFPDVRKPSKAFGYQSLYANATACLGFSGIDLQTGILPNRMQSLGLGFKPEAFDVQSDNALFKDYLRYVGNEPSHGLLTMVVFRPIMTVPGFVTKQIARRMRF